MKTVRLQKYIADCGVTSRRKAEEMILLGQVKINGEVVTELGTKVDPATDIVMVDDVPIDTNRIEPVYVLLNKPRCVMTTVSDPEGRETVMDLIHGVQERIYPVGRLDYLSEGLLLLTNDGELANWIMHPSREIEKVYEVKVFGAVTPAILNKLRDGVMTEVGFLKPKAVRVIKQLPNKTWLEFRLVEGRNREIRRLVEAAGMTVDKLKRMAIGALTVEGVAPGHYRYLSKSQVLSALGMNQKGEVIESIEYWSPKKTVDLKRKGPQATTAADDQAFTKFRKETYFQSVKEIQERKVLIEQTKEFEVLHAKEEAHQKRKQKKVARGQQKLEQKKFVHAQIL